MSLGRKIGRSFLKVAQMGDEINEGLDDLFGSNRTKPGESFSRDRVGRKAASFTENNNSKDFFGESNMDDGDVGNNFLGKSDSEKKDRRFF